MVIDSTLTLDELITFVQYHQSKEKFTKKTYLINYGSYGGMVLLSFLLLIVSYFLESWPLFGFSVVEILLFGFECATWKQRWLKKIEKIIRKNPTKALKVDPSTLTYHCTTDFQSDKVITSDSDTVITYCYADFVSFSETDTYYFMTFTNNRMLFFIKDTVMTREQFEEAAALINRYRNRFCQS